MGEARRRKATGDMAPNPKYRKHKKITRKQEAEITSTLIAQYMMGFPKLYRR